MQNNNKIEIIIGTYEAFLLGYKLEFKDDKYSLIQSFADKSHTAAIKCVAIYNKWMATGGADDRIFIYDMETRQQSQILMIHEGTINTLDFTLEGSHLLSGADDGRIVVTNATTWNPEAMWKVHASKPVTRITCHPSGKLAFSLDSNLVLCTWNLAKGRVAYKKNLKSRPSLERQPDCLTHSPSGQKFVICGPRIVEIWSLSSGDVEHSTQTTSKPICVTWLNDQTCLVGLENGNILWIVIKNNSENQDEQDEQDEGDSMEKEEIPAHSARLKAMGTFHNYLVTASSSGEVKVWELSMEKQERLTEIAVTNIGCRPTTLNILQQSQQQSEDQTSSNHNDNENESQSIHNFIKAPDRGTVTIEYDHTNENNSENESQQESESQNVENDENSAAENETHGSDNEENTSRNNTEKRNRPLKRKKPSNDDTKEKRQKRK